ncbi:MAG TPA: ATP-binding protein [Chryseosolibacter sp.]
MGHRKMSGPLHIDLSDMAPCGLVYADATGGILQVNNAFSRMVQSFVLPVHGNRFQNYLSTASKLFYEVHHLPMLALQGFASEMMCDLHVTPTETIPVCIMSKVHVSKDGTRFHCHAIFERSNASKHEKKLVQQKAESDKALQKRTAFMSMASHEIKNPLQLMQTASDLLSRGMVNDEQRKYLDVLRSSADALLKVTADIMQIGKLDDPQIELLLRPTDLSSLLSNLSNSLLLKASAKKLKLDLFTDQRLPRLVLTDETKLQVVLTNLLSNAIKYTNEGSILLSATTVQLSDRSVSVKFKVQDTGIGIPGDKLHTIFELFRQVDGRASGFGLGLAIAQRIVRLLGGSLHVETSTTGSTFWFTSTFNYVNEQLEEPTIEASTSSSNGTRILLAEDNELNAELIGKMLAISSHSVEKVSNGKRAWEQINMNKFDLVLADIQMPELNGLELLKNIRSSDDEGIRNLPVIIISGESAVDHSDFISEYRPTDWLVKPFRMQDLLAKIAFLKKEIPQTTQEMFPKIRSLCSDNNQYRQVLQKTMDMLNHDEQALNKAVSDGDSSALRKVIHKLSSSLSYLDASGLRQELAQLPPVMLEHGSNGMATISIMANVNTNFTSLKHSIQRALTSHN